VTEREILDALRQAYPPPAWAFLEHVADGTGSNQRRTSDAMAMSLWPSRGLYLHGFEVKTFRGDWLRELRDPHKADEMVSRCHHWWVVAGDDHVVQASEVPPTWGLMVGPNLAIVKPALVLTPAALDYPFLAAVLRRAAETFVVGRRERIRDDAYVEAQANALDPVKGRARLNRLLATSQKITTEISSALWQFDHAEHRAKWDETPEVSDPSKDKGG